MQEFDTLTDEQLWELANPKARPQRAKVVAPNFAPDATISDYIERQNRVSVIKAHLSRLRKAYGTLADIPQDQLGFDPCDVEQGSVQALSANLVAFELAKKNIKAKVRNVKSALKLVDCDDDKPYWLKAKREFRNRIVEGQSAQTSAISLKQMMADPVLSTGSKFMYFCLCACLGGIRNTYSPLAMNLVQAMSGLSSDRCHICLAELLSRGYIEKSTTYNNYYRIAVGMEASKSNFSF